MRFRYLIFILFIAITAFAQDTRTTSTRIADALALLPARNSETAGMAYAELMSLDEEGLAKVFDGVRPNGEVAGVPYRYAVALLATRTSGTGDRSRIEKSLIGAIARSNDAEVKQYFISYLAIVGTNQSVLVLAGFLTDTKLADAAARALETINSDLATEALRSRQNAVSASSPFKSEPSQQNAQLAILKSQNAATSAKRLIAELDRFDERYRNQILRLGAEYAHLEAPRRDWIAAYNRAKEDKQAAILQMLASVNLDEDFTGKLVLPALDSNYPSVRKVAVQALGATRNPKYADRIAAILINPSKAADEHELATKSFLQIAQPEHVRKLAKLLPQVNPAVAPNILSIVSARRDTDDAQIVINLTSSTDPKVRAAAFAALADVASPAVLDKLMALLPGLTVQSEISAVQKALIAIANPETASAILKETVNQRARLLPVLPYIPDTKSLTMVKESFEKGNGEEKDLAFGALLDWQRKDAVPYLLSMLRDKNQAAFHARAFNAFVKQVTISDWSADQKLLKLREVFTLATTSDSRKLIIREAGGLRTFQSFAFVSAYLDDAELGSTASRSIMRLTLPTADGQPGMTGQEVRKALEKVMGKLTGPDSQYDRIDVQAYLDQLPYTVGFEPLFNGKDLTGWQGLVENPIAREKLTKEELAGKQAVANAKLSESWSIKDGMICFTGTGDNLCTKRSFGDIEMFVDYRISKDGDSGIYLRGSPQVQIWDIARTDVGAQVGSGGLYNNTVNRNPLVLADNAIGDWNTLHITMIGERVTVYLNGVLTVDNVVMENYWDRKIPIFPSGPIELQAHGTELAFRDVYVRELNRPYQLSAEEKKQGFEVLFNGNNLDGWVGNKTDYVVDDHVIAIYPTGRGKGNLYTEKEYGDFIYRFEFQLTPAGNNGLGIHAPLEGDAAYVGKEIQILDDGHQAYANLQPYQAHGSVYGVIAAKRGFLKPTGQWNYEEVEVRGDKIKVTLNGTVIVDGDMKKASQNGTLDKQNHPGLQRHRGHIGFLGHGSVVRFRNVRIKELSEK